MLQFLWHPIHSRIQDPRRPVSSVAPSGFLCALRIIGKSPDTLWAPMSPSSSANPRVSEVPSKCYLTRTVRKASAFEASLSFGCVPVFLAAASLQDSRALQAPGRTPASYLPFNCCKGPQDKESGAPFCTWGVLFMCSSFRSALLSIR